LLVPSTIPRVIVLLPIAASLAETMGYKTGSRGHVGLCAMAATTTLLPTYAFLTANLPTIIEFGAIETLYGLKPSYAEYFTQQLPINLVRFVALLVILLPFAPDRSEMANEMPKASPLTDVQRRLLVVLGVAILFWATDGWHQISPAWIALAAATVLLVPAFGMLDKGVMKSNIDMSPAFFLAGVFCVSAVAAHSGLSTHVADALIPRMGLGQGSALKDLYAISGFSVLISHLATAPAAPVILAPLAEPIATAAGWSVKTVAMAQVVGIATPLLPYQAPPLIIAIGLAQIPIGALVRICVLLAVAVAVIGIPLTYVWWQFLGIL
jgi:di/tricarboxylate transporter